jgi:opacity protein-like surface antigen
MKQLMLAICIGALSALTAAAQIDDYKKGEFFIGYSNNQVDTGVSPDEDFSDFVDERETFHGFNVSGVYNFQRYFGIKGDISGGYNSKTFDFTVPTAPPSTGEVSFDADSSLYNFLGGIQIKDNGSEARLKPFAHALAGVGHGRVKVSNVVCDPAVDCTGLTGTTSETGFAGAFGGGLDFKINDGIDLRLIQVDYNPIRFDSGTTHNVRFGIGLVFR